MRRVPGSPPRWSPLALVAVLTALDQTVATTALPRMIADLQGASFLGRVFTAYFLSATVTVAVAGTLAVLWQAINKIGLATASAIGPSVGGVLSDNLSWYWNFLVNVPVCLVIVLSPICAFVAGQLLSHRGRARAHRSSRSGGLPHIPPPQVGRSVGAWLGTALIGASVRSSVAVDAGAGMEMAIRTAVVVQLGAGSVVAFAVWLMADLPLGTTRGVDTERTPTRGRAWSQVRLEH